MVFSTSAKFMTRFLPATTRRIDAKTMASIMATANKTPEVIMINLIVGDNENGNCSRDLRLSSSARKVWSVVLVAAVIVVAVTDEIHP